MLKYAKPAVWRKLFLISGSFWYQFYRFWFCVCGDCGEICCPLVELTKWIGTKASFATSSHPIMYINKMFNGVCYQAAGDNKKFSLAKYQSFFLFLLVKMPFCVTYSSTCELSLGRSFNPLLVAKEKKFTQIVKKILLCNSSVKEVAFEW